LGKWFGECEEKANSLENVKRDELVELDEMKKKI
jgi:hypothetical protein